jgi:hypothetical protein
MAQITADQHRRYGRFLTGAIPRSTLAAIDGEELEDRLHQASSLIAKGQQAATPGAGKRFGEEANRILTARPRSETEAIVVAKMARARTLASVDPGRAAGLEQQARDELLAHQPAVRRRDARGVAVAKAEAEPADNGLVICYNAQGKPVRCGRMEDHIPLTDPDDMPSGQVIKNTRRAR